MAELRAESQKLYEQKVALESKGDGSDKEVKRLQKQLVAMRKERVTLNAEKRATLSLEAERAKLRALQKAMKRQAG